MSTNLVDGRILITDDFTVDQVQEALLAKGYKWLKPGKMDLSDTIVNSLFFYKDGSIKYSGIRETDSDWYTRTSQEFTMVDSVLVPKKEWERGDPGPAPLHYIFEDIPPNEEEAPGGYLRSSSGDRFQRSEAAMVWCGVRIVLESDTKGLEVQFKRIGEKLSDRKQ